jgi:hypothetical protein
MDQARNGMNEKKGDGRQREISILNFSSSASLGCGSVHEKE